MPVKALHSRAAHVPAEGGPTLLQWLLTETRHETTLDGLMAAFCLRLRGAGFPIARSVLQVHTHHPQWLGTRIVWRRGELGAVAEPIAYGVMQSRMYLDSPVAALHDGVDMVRVRLEGAPPAKEYPMFASLRRDGFTDYVGWPLLFTLDQMHTITFASDRRGGFTAAELECVAGLLPAFALTIEVRFKNELSRRLLDTYVGPHAGEQILSGMTTRGSGRTIEAAVAMFDLRGFTALSDTHSRDDVIAILNDYFDAIAEPIGRHGGEILKFMGDGLLAVFPLDRAAACEDALSAVSDACAAMRALNDVRRAACKEVLGFGVGVNVGEVMYGNIGTSARLDFTVIGPAVNAAARLESLTKDVGVFALFSEAFAEMAHSKSLVSQGRHCLRGFGKPIEVFTFAGPQ